MAGRISRENALAICCREENADLPDSFGQTRGHFHAVASTGELDVKHGQIGIAEFPEAQCLIRSCRNTADRVTAIGDYLLGHFGDMGIVFGYQDSLHFRCLDLDWIG
jgi:hypothetical protein